MLQDGEVNLNPLNVILKTVRQPIDFIDRIWVLSFAQRFKIVERCSAGRKL